MSVQFKFFTIPVNDSSETEDEFNRFLRSKRILTVYKEFLKRGEDAFWCIAVEYMEGGSQDIKSKQRVDYRNILSPEDFAVFAGLREWRKQAAAKDAVPVYTIFTNEQLAAMAQNRVKTSQALRAIENVGEAKTKKYGKEVIETMNRLTEAKQENP